MAQCWTCGSPVDHWQFTCIRCESLKELKEIRQQLESVQTSASQGYQQIAEVQRATAQTLQHNFGKGLAEIATALEWGFEEVKWRLDQQRRLLARIDVTIRHPRATKASELRKMADELRQRAALDKAEEFYQEALALNPLDYRIYVGLARTYLQLASPERALAILEQSLPMAPRDEKRDFKSYSYRLIGRIHACLGDHTKAAEALSKSVELTPNYPEAQYDYAQYCGQLRDPTSAKPALEKAIKAKPVFWYLAPHEKNFAPISAHVSRWRRDLLDAIWMPAKEIAEPAIGRLGQLTDTLTKLQQITDHASFRVFRNQMDGCMAKAERLGDYLTKAADDYHAALLAIKTARELEQDSTELASSVTDALPTAETRFIAQREQRARERRNETSTAVFLTIGLGFVGWFLGGTVGCFARGPYGQPFAAYDGVPGGLGFIIGIVLGLLLNSGTLFGDTNRSN